MRAFLLAVALCSAVAHAQLDLSTIVRTRDFIAEVVSYALQLSFRQFFFLSCVAALPIFISVSLSLFSLRRCS